MIKIENLDFAYENEKILCDINLEVNNGDYLAIIGGNGTGKSTLVKCLIGMNKVNCGAITIDGTDINDFKDYSRIGYVGQVKAKVSDIPISGREYLNLISRDKKRINKLIDELNLESFIDLNMNNLSGGQVQRINIAKSMLHDIEYLILDEPNTGLDLENRQSFYQLLGELNEKGLTIIIISHHIDEISCRINRVFDMGTKELKEFDQDGCKYC